MSDPAKKTYADYCGRGYQVAAAYFADGYHYQVLQSNTDVVIAQIPHEKVLNDGFVMDSEVQITRVMR